MSSENPLLDDDNARFTLQSMVDIDRLLSLPYFQDHNRDTLELYLNSARRLARTQLFPAYKPMDEAPPELTDGKLPLHPLMHQLYPQLVELGLIAATRPFEVGGQQLPQVISALAGCYLMAGNLNITALLGLTTGAARLIESFGEAPVKEAFMDKMYSGEWTGTMALTEPQAGSSLTDVQSKAVPAEAGHYRIRGSKVFISGGDHDLTENIVHLALARIEGAPEGIKGVSLFAIPKRRYEGGLSGGALVDNDVVTAGVFHKVGWRGLPSIALNYGERDDCWGWLVGPPHRGIICMFQMMNEARLMVGANAVATSAVAYHEAVEYARGRPQGRKLGDRDPSAPQIPIIEHADVRRMLLRQRAIVDGGMALVLKAAYLADLAEHSDNEEERKNSGLLLDLLIPIVKTFPAEYGFESNALAVQIHGGYGYTSEYLPESWMRDQKLNTIHEGTTCMHSMDLLGRKAMAQGGAPLMLFAQEVQATLTRAREVGLPEAWCERVETVLTDTGALTQHLGMMGLSQDLEGMMLHSVDYLTLTSILGAGWLLLEQAQQAKRALDEGKGPEAVLQAKLHTAQYWIMTEVARAPALIELIKSGEDSYLKMKPQWF